MKLKKFFSKLFMSSETKRRQDLLNMLHDSGVIFIAPNPLQPITIRYWDLDHEALSFKKEPYLSQI